MYQIFIFENKCVPWNQLLEANRLHVLDAHISIFMLSKINLISSVGSCKINIFLLLQYFFVSNITMTQIQYKDVILRV